MYNEGRDQIYITATQECQQLPAKHLKLGRGKEDSHYRFQREHGPANTLISDLQPPEL